MKRTLILTVALLVVASYVSLSAEDNILVKVDRNLQPYSFEMYRKLINYEPDGGKKEFVLWTAKKGDDKVAATFLEPPSEKGRSTLRLGDNMWLYIPNVGKPIRITSLQSVVGGVFNNSDIMRLDFSAEYNLVKQEDKGDHLLLTLKAKDRTVAYDKLMMQVDKKHLVPTEIGCYAATGMLIKTLTYKNIKDFGNGIKRPSVLETTSPLHQGYKSVMIFATIKPREFADEVFTLDYLPRINELR